MMMMQLVLLIVGFFAFVFEHGEAFQNQFIHDGKTVYCWQYKASLSLNTVPQEDILHSGKGVECPLIINLNQPEYKFEELEKFDIIWKVELIRDRLKQNKIRMNQIHKHSIEQPYDIPHSNVHFCEFGSNCSPHNPGTGGISNSVNQPANLDAYNKKEYHLKLHQFNRPGVFTVVAHTFMQGPNNTRFDFAVYSKADILSKSSKGSDTVVIVIVVCGVIVVAIIAMVIVLVYKRRRRRQMLDESHLDSAYVIFNKSPSTDRTSVEGYFSMEEMSSTLKKGEIPFWNDPDLLTLQLNKEVVVHKRLSAGAYGEVWLGEYMGKQVALKFLLRNKKSSLKELQVFTEEIKLMSKLDHPRVVTFIGASWNKIQDICAVLEFLPGGDLRGLLVARKDLTWKGQKLQIAMDIVEALIYLHSFHPKIIHRDLKSKNVLMDNDLRAKLTDFGVSREQLVDQSMTQSVGTALWMAPEVLNGERYDESADIYSFGVIISELDSCELPFANVKSETGEKIAEFKLLQLISSGSVPLAWSDNCPMSLKDFTKQCLSIDRTARPTAMEVYFHLSSVVQADLDEK